MRAHLESPPDDKLLQLLIPRDEHQILILRQERNDTLERFEWGHEDGDGVEDDGILTGDEGA